MARHRTRRRAIAARLFVVACASGASGCLASKGDVVILQDEMRSLRASIAQSDTARRAQTDTALLYAARANDSIRALGVRLAAFQANASGALYDMGRQLLQIQELTGQTQRRLQEVRASFETRMEAMNAGVAPAPVAGGDSAHPSPPSGGPGPAQLFQAGFEQMQRGSFAAARSAFQELLDRYPTVEDAPAAQLHVGESFAEERNTAAADSVFQLVVARYPQSKAAPTALYKYAQSLIAQKKSTAARAALNRVVKEYPASDEASLARDLLRTMR